LLSRCGRLHRRRQRPVARIPVGTIADADPEPVGHGRATFQRVVRNLEGEDISLALRGYALRHGTTPVKALPSGHRLACHRTRRRALRHTGGVDVWTDWALAEPGDLRRHNSWFCETVIPQQQRPG